MKIARLIFLISFFSFLACSNLASEAKEINNYNDCIAAGNPILRSYPPKCIANGQTYVKKVKKVNAHPQRLCIDRCGDNTCQEIVCMGSGCPCSENVNKCPQDCK